MNFKFIINLIIMIFFLSCDNTSTNPENETTTTGGDSENNLIEIQVSLFHRDNGE